jgi:diaminopimelate epimerase
LVKGDEVRIETGAGVRIVRIYAEGGKARRARVNMGAPRLARSHVPMLGPECPVVREDLAIEVPSQGAKTFHITAVSMGNPHCVIYVDDTDAFPVALYGPLIERHPAFPKRTNVEFVQVLSAGEAKMRVWERGSGETLACGTGASATCVAGVLNKKTDRRLFLHLLGGDLELEWADDGSVYLTGPAEEVFEGVAEV